MRVLFNDNEMPFNFCVSSHSVQFTEHNRYLGDKKVQQGRLTLRSSSTTLCKDRVAHDRSNETISGWSEFKNKNIEFDYHSNNFILKTFWRKTKIKCKMFNQVTNLQLIIIIFKTFM